MGNTSRFHLGEVPLASSHASMHMRINGSDCQLRMIFKYDFACLSYNSLSFVWYVLGHCLFLNVYLDICRPNILKKMYFHCIFVVCTIQRALAFLQRSYMILESSLFVYWVHVVCL